MKDLVSLMCGNAGPVKTYPCKEVLHKCVRHAVIDELDEAMFYKGVCDLLRDCFSALGWTRCEVSKVEGLKFYNYVGGSQTM